MYVGLCFRYWMEGYSNLLASEASLYLYVVV